MSNKADVVAALRAVREVALALPGDVEPPREPTIVGFSATPGIITPGEAVTLDATIANAVSVELDGVVIPGMPQVVVPTATRTYTLKAIGAPGTTPATASLAVTVRAQGGTIVAAFGSAMVSNHWNTGVADRIDVAALPSVRVPWTNYEDAAQRILAGSCNGVKPAQLRLINLYGNTNQLYSHAPMIVTDPATGKPIHRHWNPEVYSGRDFASIEPRVRNDPPPTGGRGDCAVDPYITWRAHPFPTTPPSLHAPLFLGIDAAGRMYFAMADGSMTTAGLVPGQKNAHDFALIPSDRAKFYVANMQEVCLVDRTRAVAARVAGGIEDASLYDVTVIAAGFSKATSVEVMQDESVYACDETAGIVYKVDPVAQTKTPIITGLDRPFCIRRLSTGKLLVATLGLAVYEIDLAAGTLGPNRMPVQEARSIPAAEQQWTWLGVDEYGVLGPVDTVVVTDSTAHQNVAQWQIEPNGTVSLNQGFWKNGSSVTNLGNAATSAEWIHYGWSFTFHSQQGIALTQGFAQMYPTVVRAPIPSDVPEEQHDHMLYRRYQEIVKSGTSRKNPQLRPSFTALMNPSGWGLLGITADYMVQQATTRGWAWLETFIQSGMGGMTPRPEIVGRDLLAMFYGIVKCSQQYLSRGAMLWIAAKVYVIGKYPTAASSDGADGNTVPLMGGGELFLRAIVSDGKLTVRGEDKWGNPKAIPMSATVTVELDQGPVGGTQSFALVAPWQMPMPLVDGPAAITCNSVGAYSYGVTI